MRGFLSTPPEATLESPDYAIIAMVQGSLGEPGVTLGGRRGSVVSAAKPSPALSATLPIRSQRRSAISG
jgi:hypothetical protein